jgi:signal transduction histidine kinase/pSer/pThr/pTyr-binding forkhead associated (FHA) protein
VATDGKTDLSKATLLVIRGTDQGTRFEIGQELVSLGRGSRNDIRIGDTEVSRQHASIHFTDGLFVLRDRGSANGTLVNGAVVRMKELRDGDQLQLGGTVLLFQQSPKGNGSEEAAQRIDLVGLPNSEDQSNIVAELGQEPQPLVADRTSVARATASTQALSNLQAVYRIAEEAVSPALSVDQMLKRILDLTIGVVGADRGCMLITDPQTGQSVPKVISFGRRADQATRMPVSRSIVDYVLKKGQGVRTSDARSDRRFAPGQSILQAGICEAMCVPMQGRYDVPGVIYVDTTTSPERVILEGGVTHKFSDDQLRLLVAIGSQAALAIENSRYQEALLKAERLAAMGQTIAMLSHHIKNILQGVRGGSYLIDLGLKEHNEDHVRKGWAIVEKNQNKIYQLVMDMLAFSKERQPVMQAASLNQTVGEVCELMQARAGECRVRLEVRLNESLPTATFDVEGIHRAVLNVVTNAIDAVEGTATGHVIVETGHETANDVVFVSVTDNGAGIPEDQLGRIFNIFESTKGARGTGLGLAVSQKILREHGGDITVQTKPGFGCRFVLNWPRMDEEHRGEHPTMI